MAGNGKVAVCFLGMEDPKTSTQDPAFNALIESGFTVSAHMIVERMGKHELCLLMTKQQQPVVDFNIQRLWLVLFAAFLLAGNAITLTLAHYL
jgi:hypothetical protein